MTRTEPRVPGLPERRIGALLTWASIRTAAICVGVLLVVAPVARAQEGPTPDGRSEAGAALQLAEQYVPVLMLKEQQDECDPDGEQYEPIDVEAILGNPEILLRQLGNGDPVVQRAPTATDLFGLGEGFFLDFPGSALQPGCIYERDGRRYAGDRPATVYAHVIENVGDGELVLQYWFYWYFNDWNNKHESDWEGIALHFPVATADEALSVSPVRVGYAQHEGGVVADWNGGGVETDGSRPVVYPSAGSHASYTGSALYLGRSASEGFGCDTTDGPSRRVDPVVKLLPSQVEDADDPMAWLAFEGRWGERQSGPFNGPTGPTSKERWSDPLSWFDELRSTSVTVPSGDGAANDVVYAFCDVVAGGSNLLIAFTTSPTRLLLTLGALGGIVLLAFNRTDWTVVAGLPVRMTRRYGQILRSSWQLYWRNLATFAPIGWIYIPVLLLAAIVVELLGVLPVVGPLMEAAGDRTGAGAFLALLVAALPALVSYVTVNAAVSDAMSELEAGRDPTVSGAYRVVLARARALYGGLARASVIVGVLYASIVGIPWGVRQFVRYQFLAPVIMLEQRDAGDGLRRSGELTTGRWWHTAFVITLVHGVMFSIGLLIGLLTLVIATALPLWFFMVLFTLVSTALSPVVAIAVTQLYGDAVVACDLSGTTTGDDALADATPVG